MLHMTIKSTKDIFYSHFNNLLLIKKIYRKIFLTKSLEKHIRRGMLTIKSH